MLACKIVSWPIGCVENVGICIFRLPPSLSINTNLSVGFHTLSRVCVCLCSFDFKYKPYVLRFEWQINAHAEDKHIRWPHETVVLSSCSFIIHCSCRMLTTRDSSWLAIILFVCEEGMQQKKNERNSMNEIFKLLFTLLFVFTSVHIFEFKMSTCLYVYGARIWYAWRTVRHVYVAAY